MTDGVAPMTRGKGFSAPMVRALRRGTKTQTRRLYSSFAMAGAGRADDVLYVREGWKTAAGHNKRKPVDIVPGAPIFYVADSAVRMQHANMLIEWGRYRGERYMPCWASRLTLVIESVHIEPLQTIATYDATCEGIVNRGAGLWSATDEQGGMMHGDPIEAYRELWDSLHREEHTTWNDNPNVIVTAFKVHQVNVDDFNG